MNARILDEKTIGEKHWYLCQVNLKNYLDELRPNFYDFAIQRSIVKNNKYIDRIYDTVKLKEPIPAITLTCSDNFLPIDASVSINMQNIEILDGLQRTFRLWAYNKLATLYREGMSTENLAQQMKAEFPPLFETGVLSTSIIRGLIDSKDISDIKDNLSDYDINIVIWTGLNDAEIIQKMLQLNAGQTPVSSKHQFELLFLHFYNKIASERNQSGVILYRDKDDEASRIKNGNRDVGQFLFSDITIALQSMLNKKTMQLADYTGKLQEDIQLLTNESIINDQFLRFYLSELHNLDLIIREKENVYGIAWFGRETTLSGVFAAIGKFANIDERVNTTELINRISIVFQNLNNKINTEGLNLNEYKAEMHILSNRQANIGNFTRKIIMEYVFKLLGNENPNWKSLFALHKKEQKEVSYAR